MPLYEYQCKSGHRFERVLPVSEWNKPQKCECGKEGKKILSPFQFHVKQFENYESPVTGEVISSEKQRQEDMARNNCVEYDPGMLQDYHSRIEESDKKLDKAMDDTVEEVFEKMPSDKREQLANELLDGAEVDVKRN